MDVNSATLRNIDTRHSYYLDGKCLKVTYAISGAQLRAIANRFCSAHAAIGRSDRRRLAETCAESAVNAALNEAADAIRPKT